MPSIVAEVIGRHLLALKRRLEDPRPTRGLRERGFTELHVRYLSMLKSDIPDSTTNETRKPRRGSNDQRSKDGEALFARLCPDIALRGVVPSGLTVSQCHG